MSKKCFIPWLGKCINTVLYLQSLLKSVALSTLEVGVHMTRIESAHEVNVLLLQLWRQGALTWLVALGSWRCMSGPVGAWCDMIYSTVILLTLQILWPALPSSID